MATSDRTAKTGLAHALPGYGDMRTAILEVIEAARSASARSVNALMTASYWDTGRRIVEFEQRGKDRAEYGSALLERLGADLSRTLGRGFRARNLAHMRAFHLSWSLDQILQTASAKSSQGPAHAGTPQTLASLATLFPLPWSAYVHLLSVSDPTARRFYEAEALRCGWSVRQLDRQICSKFYERTARTRRSAPRAGHRDAQAADTVIHDPFVLEFLNLKDEYSESGLEDALIQRMSGFLLELGDDFAFVGRQRRLRLDNNWFRVDLLFFHRRLRCLVIIDIKTGRFSHADAGQMHMYLNYASEHWVKAGENPPVGLILCTSIGHFEAHYALSELPNQVLAAEYRTVLPDQKLLAAAMDRSQQELAADTLSSA